ncbi:MAG: hypothetical protein KJP21_06765 [Bacteroidia bacterium]|nr:hypothetical protein [Bacteroidia bacterium]NNJ56416.1 hypothetical protein [Bacteroidia bacterium]
MKKIKYISIFLLFAVAFSSCKDETSAPTPEPAEEVQEISFSVSNQANGEEIDFLNSTYTLPSSEEIIISRLAYILADFILVKDDNSEIILDDQYVLINPKFAAPKFTLKNIPKGNYKSIKFSLGLDSSINHGDPSKYDVEHPLSPVNNSLHWSWTGGYIFAAIEGKLKSDNSSFIFHLAGSQNKLDYELTLPFEKKVNALRATMEMNFDEIFKNPETYSLANDGMGTHSTTDAVTTKLFGNMGDIFTITEIKE